MKFEYLPHTADIRMKIEADSLPLLFKAGLIGMSEILKENHCLNNGTGDIRRIATVNAPDISCLLIDFLSDVLSSCYTENAIFCDFEIMEFSEHLISAEILGSAVSEFSEEIKAVTYHEADVKRNASGTWESIVVFDI